MGFSMTFLSRLVSMVVVSLVSLHSVQLSAAWSFAPMASEAACAAGGSAASPAPVVVPDATGGRGRIAPFSDAAIETMLADYDRMLEFPKDTAPHKIVLEDAARFGVKEVGRSSITGCRDSNEDAEFARIHKDGFLFGGVCDGFGSHLTAHWLSNYLLDFVAAVLRTTGDVKAALEIAFLDADHLLCSPAFIRAFNYSCGSTATTFLITREGRLFTANTGDSRTIVGKRGGGFSTTTDHKPDVAAELMRIRAAGCDVSMWGSVRISGKHTETELAVGRAFGAAAFKKLPGGEAYQQRGFGREKRDLRQRVCDGTDALTSMPDVIEHGNVADYLYIVAACDGVWDVLTREDVDLIVREEMAKATPAENIAERIIDIARARKSTDNVTALVTILAS